MKIQLDKLYSVREAAKLIPFINCGPTLQKLIDLDIKKTKGQVLKVKVLKRNKQRRYFLRGEDLKNIIDNKIIETKNK